MANGSPRLGGTQGIVEGAATPPAAPPLPAPPEATPTPELPATVIIHFVDDGFIAFGRSWFRGQEMEIATDGEQWKTTYAKIHKSDPTTKQYWPLLDEYQQIAKYGKRFFAQGPWPGRRDFDGASFENLKGAGLPSQAELVAALNASNRVRV
jgi:hypothetical protein